MSFSLLQSLAFAAAFYVRKVSDEAFAVTAQAYPPGMSPIDFVINARYAVHGYAFLCHRTNPQKRQVRAPECMPLF